MVPIPSSMSFDSSEVAVMKPTCQPCLDRFKDNPYVTGELGNIVFYAAAPLVTSLGHRLGSLCVIDYRPREFDAECCNMLANFAEIVVRDTERYTAALEELTVRFLRGAAASLALCSHSACSVLVSDCHGSIPIRLTPSRSALYISAADLRRSAAALTVTTGLQHYPLHISSMQQLCWLWALRVHIRVGHVATLLDGVLSLSTTRWLFLQSPFDLYDSP
jgi:hypothetical protein